MIWLLLCIVLTTSFFIIFKFFQKFQVDTFQAIVYNYFTCIIIGLIFSYGSDYQVFFNDIDWLPYAIGLGILFISIFFLMAKTAQEISVSASTVSSKISMLIPVSVSLFLHPVLLEKVTFWTVFGFIFALISLFLITYRKNEVVNSKRNWWLVPIVFIGSGLVDAIINIVNSNYGSSDFNHLFPVVCFSIAGMGGFMVSLFLIKSKFQWKNLIWGVILGIPNFFSVYTLLQSLSFYQFNGAFVFPIVHISSILISTLLAWLIFKEKLNRRNILGLILALISVYLLAQLA